MKIKKGDTVVITAGKDKGKTGKVERVNYKKNTVLLPGLNQYKRHIKKRDEKNPGGIVDVPRALDVSKVALVDPKTKQPTRVKYSVAKGKKERVSVKSGVVIK